MSKCATGLQGSGECRIHGTLLVDLLHRKLLMSTHFATYTHVECHAVCFQALSFIAGLALQDISYTFKIFFGSSALLALVSRLLSSSER